MVVELLPGAPEQNNDSPAPFQIRSVCAAVTADQLAGCRDIVWVGLSSGGNNDDIIRISNWFLHTEIFRLLEFSLYKLPAPDLYAAVFQQCAL